MNRRIFAAGVLAASTTAIVGCNEEKKPDPLASLTNNSEIHEAVKALVDAYEDLEGSVEDFDTNDWRSVVPDVQAGTADVGDAITKLKVALRYF